MTEIEYYANRIPKTREQIAVWIAQFLNVKPLSTVRCIHDPKHDSQLDYISEAFFCEYSNGVYMASRYGGKSFAAAIVLLLDSWFYPGIESAVAAWKRDQGDFIYNYLVKFIGIMNEKLSRAKKKGIATILKDSITFENGSIVSFYSGAMSKGGIKGAHPYRLYIDEVDLFTQKQFDGIGNALASDGRFKTRIDLLSTNYRQDGVILKQIERIETFNAKLIGSQRPMRVFKTCLLDILQKCDERYNCKTCTLFHYCKGQAKEGNGIYAIESAIGLMATESRQNFESEMLLLRPTSEFTYFHNFDTIANISTPDREYDPTLLSFVMFDFGGSRNKHAALVVQKSQTVKGDARFKYTDGTYFVIDEFIVPKGDLELLTAKVLAKYPFAVEFDCFCDPKGNTVEQHREGTSFVGVLRKEGFHPRFKQLKRDPTAQLIYNLIDPADGIPRLLVNSRCKGLLKEIYAAECKVDRKNRPTTEFADDEEDDLLDCLRYCVGWTVGDYKKHHGKGHLGFW